MTFVRVGPRTRTLYRVGEVGYFLDYEELKVKHSWFGSVFFPHVHND